MAAYISFQPSDFFSTKLYTGTGGASGTTQTITGVGFQSDLSWIKGREGFDNVLQDSVRGATYQINSNNPDAQTNRTDELTAWTSDGFALGIDTFEGVVNNSGNTYASWNWKAGTTSGLTGGTITPTGYSLNTTPGQSIIAYTGTGSNATVPHGLGVAPDMIILKRLNSSDNWNLGHNSLNSGTDPWDYTMKLNNTSLKTNDATIWNDTAPTTTVFSIGTSTEVNYSAATYIAYCFAPIKGYSKFGDYTGNGNVDGTFVYTGFRPAFVLLKSYSDAESWTIQDDKRLGYNPKNYTLRPANNAAASSTNYMDLVSNGFKIRNTNTEAGASGYKYLYAAFAEFPIVSSNSKVGKAR